jgi:hypothetical protein
MLQNASLPTSDRQVISQYSEFGATLQQPEYDWRAKKRQKAGKSLDSTLIPVENRCQD